MSDQDKQWPLGRARFFQYSLHAAYLFLCIEFFDELNYGLQSAALPAIRLDLGINYAQVGVLLGVSGMVGALVEPGLLLLGDTRHRTALMAGGGVMIAAGLMLLAGAHSLATALLALCLAFPASGAFVSLAQAALMDRSPGRQAAMMARWTVAGSLGSLAGPLLLAGGLALGLGWRAFLSGLAIICLALAALTWTNRAGDRPVIAMRSGGIFKLHEITTHVFQALNTPNLMKWLGLLELSNLLLDIYTSYLGLYLADAVGLSQTQVALVLGGLMLASLLADLLLIPLLERAPDLNIVRLSAMLALLVYPAMLIAPCTALKLILALGVRFTTIGWYPVLQARVYASLPERSGLAAALTSVAGLFGQSLTWLVGWIAAQAGLPAAMWLLALGPLALALFLPWQSTRRVEKV